MQGLKYSDLKNLGTQPFYLILHQIYRELTHGKMTRFLQSAAFILQILVLLVLMSCNEEPLPDNPSDLEAGKFLLLPGVPTSNDIVKMVTYDCKYNVLAGVKIKGKEIEVKKRFNSQMKWPCILQNDTISLGKLTKGNYKVTFLVIDKNPAVTDSIFSSEAVTLSIKK